MDRPDLQYVVSELAASLAVKQRILHDTALLELLTSMGHLLIDCYLAGNKLLIAGNGGSAANAQHIAAEFVGRFNFDRPGLPALALSTDTSILTAVGNDYGFDQLFRRRTAHREISFWVFPPPETAPMYWRRCVPAKRKGLSVSV